MADRAEYDSLPLKGIVLCCTSIPQEVRTEYAQYATEMGAVHCLDLTSEVTHLIVGNIATPKYQYTAKLRPDIAVVSAQWILAVRQKWMDGEDVDVQTLEKTHGLPTFFGLNLCMTGFRDIELMSSVEQRAREQGAAFNGDLTKQITHLIAAAPEGAKYKFAKEWGIRIVTLKWFWDSLERGMSLDESLYDPLRPEEEQGQGAFKRRSFLGKRTRTVAGDGASDDGNKRKLRRTASTKLNSQSQDFWNDISLQEAPAVSHDIDQWRHEPDHRRVTDHDQHPNSRPANIDRAHAPKAPDMPKGLFSGRHILIHGFSKTHMARLREHLVPNGAVIAERASDLVTASDQVGFLDRYLLVPHTNPDMHTVTLPDVPDDTMVVSEWWLERCIDRKRILSPTEDALSRPLWEKNGKALQGLAFCMTGFSSLDFRQSVEAMKLLGATYEADLKSTVSVLISASEKLKPEKALYASKHKIPVVNAEWIWRCIEQNQKMSYQSFAIVLPKYTPASFTRESSGGSPDLGESFPRRSSSGKPLGKADAVALNYSNSASRNTPVLSLQARHGSSKLPERPNMPFVHEDDDDDDENDNDGGCAPGTNNDATAKSNPARDAPNRDEKLKSPGPQLPLTERSPNASPRKSNITLERSKVMSSASTEAPDEGRQQDGESLCSKHASAQRPSHELAADLASILQRATSRSANSTFEEPVGSLRKARPLGRNLSGTGLAQAHRSSSVSNQLVSLDSMGEPDGTENALAGHEKELEPAPGTQLGYETAEAEACRLQMEKRLKGKSTNDNGIKRGVGHGSAANTTSNSRAQGRSRRTRT